MKIFSELKRLSIELEPFIGSWAICGGVAASVYRSKPRFTNDIDIAIVDHDNLSAEDLAIKVIKSLGYKEVLGFVPSLENPSRNKKALICCRDSDNEKFIGIDFLLPVFPWVAEAVRFAQNNKLDYGFNSLATITPEDLVIAKLLALKLNSERLTDLDDINEIISNQKLNNEYIFNQSKKYDLALDSEIVEKLSKQS